MRPEPRVQAAGIKVKKAKGTSRPEQRQLAKYTTVSGGYINRITMDPAKCPRLALKFTREGLRRPRVADEATDKSEPPKRRRLTVKTRVSD